MLPAMAHSDAFAEIIVPPSAESSASTKGSTLGMREQHSGNEKTSRKRHERQGINTVDRTLADKRRGQLKQAQRKFRLRKENTIKSLQHKASSAKEVISQTSKAFLDFQEKILARGILEQAPELSRSLKSMGESIKSLTSLIISNRDVDANGAVLFPFNLETQDSGVVPESSTAEKRHPDLGRECQEQVASVGQCSSTTQVHPAGKTLEHMPKNSNTSKMEARARERTRREGEGHSIELGRRMAGKTYYSFNLPLLRHIPDTPVYDVLLERFLDAHSPVMPYYSGASDLIRAAAASRTSSPILNMAFHSLCVVYYGQVAGNLGVVNSGRRIYSKVLNTLQNALSSPEECRSIWVLLTVIVLTAYESLQHSSSGSVIKHFMGALKLLEIRGPFEHVSGLGHICYVQYRSHWVAAALICRSRTFLASKAWKTIPRSAESSTEDFMQNLLDQVVDIPALLERFDNITKSIKTGVLSPFEALDQQALLQTAVAGVKYHLHQWEKGWVESYPAGQLYEVPANTGDYLPIFRCRDSTTRDIITPTIFASSNHEIIRTMCIYYSAVVILLGVDTRLDEIKLPERYHYACLICRSLEYYIRSVPMNLMNGFGFFLRVAYDAFPKGDIEIEWVEEVFKWVAKETAIKVLGSKVPEFSV